MKKLLVVLVLGLSFTAFAQFKDTETHAPDIKQSMLANPYGGSLFGFINPNNFSMKQSYSLSYSAFAGQGLALGVYTNNMMYKFSNNLNIQLQASIVHTPYSTLGKSFENNLNGFYLSGAALNYKPWKDVSISVQYRHLPYNYYSPYYNSGFGGMNYWGYGDGSPFSSR